jgi:arylsulfatase A-like enzyme
MEDEKNALGQIQSQVECEGQAGNPNRREVLQWMAAAAALSATGEAAALPTRPLNFVYIIVDDLGWKDTGPYGNKVIDTPNLDRLATQSARFTQAYASCPVCSPSRASVLSGQYPARIGLTDYIPGSAQRPTARLITPDFLQELPLSCNTIAKSLAVKGYTSGNVGKWHLGGDGYLPTDNGFAVNVAGDDRGHPASYFGPEDFKNMRLAPEESLNERLGIEGANYVREHKDHPFFLYAGHYAVHGPIQARPEAIAKYRARNTGEINPTYCALVESMDAAVGKVLNAVDQAGIADHTVVIFTADHGGLRYERTAVSPVTTNAPLRAGKGHLFEGGVRIPLLVRWPGVTRAASVVETPVCNIDWFPTICKVVGVNPQGAVDGVDIMPVLRGKQIAARPFYWHYPHYSPQGGAPAGAVRQDNWKLIEFFEDGRLELYNLQEDIGERKNLILREPDRARKMHEMLQNWRESVNAQMPIKNPHYDAATADRGFKGEEPPTRPLPA